VFNKGGKMTEQVKVFFEQLEEKSKDNPMLKVEFAAKEISAQIQQACLDDKKVIMGDWCLYMASVLAGISCIKSSKADIIKMRAKIDLNSNSIPLVDVDTVAGKFYVGDLINKYLVNDRFSVINVYYSLYKNRHKDIVMPDIKEVNKKNTSNMGSKEYRLWDNLHNPYEEKDKYSKIYNDLEKHIEPYKIEDNYMPTVYGFVLDEITEKVAGVFPKHLNCYEMAVETVVWNAHMDY
jgi:hypothetical protein